MSNLFAWAHHLIPRQFRSWAQIRANTIRSEIIASRILTAAQNGERDPDKLCERA
jgi:hypothetical protein